MWFFEIKRNRIKVWPTTQRFGYVDSTFCHRAADDKAPNSGSLKGYGGKMAATEENSFKNMCTF